MSNFNDKLDLLSGKLRVVNKTKIWFLVPVVLVLITVIMFSIFAAVNKDFSKGINLGLDFTGGSALTVTFGKDLTDAQFKDYSNRLLACINEVAKQHGETYDCSEPQKTGSGPETGIYIKYQNGNSDIQEVNLAVSSAIVADFIDQGVTAEENVNIEAISATSAQKLIRDAIISVLVTWAVVLIYIIIRFELWSGIAAVVGLLVDVITMVCCSVIFHIQINTTFIAALITIVAYSINNTIVVFDRVREHVKFSGTNLNASNVGQEVNLAVQESLGRSLATTVTTLITILLLCIIGVDSIRYFCLPVIFGLLSGVFTSLFIAPGLYVTMRIAWFKHKDKKNEYVAIAGKNGTDAAKPAKRKRNVKANISKKYKRIRK